MATYSIAVFGGSFNPPTVGHLFAAAYAQTRGFDYVRVVPVYKHAFGKALESYATRLEMCAETFRGLRDVVVADDERRAAERGGRGLTLDLLRYYRDTGILGPAEVTLVLGADILNDLHRWEGADELFEMASVLFIGRAGYSPDGAILDRVRLRFPNLRMSLALRAPLPEVSSTRVRDLVAAGEPVEGLVPSAVQGIIRDEGLYSRPRAAPAA